MLAGIRHASAVTTVSPTYAGEITRPGDHANAIYGGEGLEPALQGAHDESRLFGILNGVKYPPGAKREGVDDAGLLGTILGELATEKRAGSTFYHEEVERRLRRTLDGSGRFLASSITRITEQKVRLMFEKGSAGGTALESILDLLGRQGAAFVMIGSGSDGYEEALKQAFLRHESFIFLNGFYRRSAVALFRRGNLFLMPSSYEPCGITQMQAMREGQPCLVHAVGGLKDTVIEGLNGFSFNGSTLVDKVDNFVRGVARALDLHRNRPGQWAALVKAAGEARFGWEESARAYAALFEGDVPVRHRPGQQQAPHL
jgi:starch synthase